MSQRATKVNMEYRQKHKNKKLNGQIHGAPYYYYFKQNIHACDDKKAKHERRLIRGFSVEKNGTFKFRSGAFNVQNFKLLDSKYKDLVVYEKKFVEYAIKNYWSNNSNKMITFKQYQHDSDSNVNVKKSKSIKHNDDSKKDDNSNYTFPGLLKRRARRLARYAGADVESSNSPIKLDLGSEYNESNEIDLSNAIKYDRVKFEWSIIGHILQYCTKLDLRCLFRTSRQSQFNINKFCFENITQDHHKYNYDDWIYMLRLKVNSNSNNAQDNIDLNIIPTDEKSIDPSKIDFRNLSYEAANKNSHNSRCFLLLSNHPMYKHVSKESINIRNLLYVVHKYNVKSDIAIVIGQELASRSTKWSWYRGHKVNQGWVLYDNIANMIIENGYLQNNMDSVIIQSYYKKGNSVKNYRILFEKESLRICQNLDATLPHNILNPKYKFQANQNKSQWKTKYFMQKCVSTQKIRIVKRETRS